MNWILLLSIIFCESYAQLTSPDEAVCEGEQIVFSCEQPGTNLRWDVSDLPGGSSNRLTSSPSSSLAGMVLIFSNDPGFGFEIHVLHSNSNSTVLTELRVTAVRQLNGVTVECVGISGVFMSTIRITSVDLPAAPSGVMTTADQHQFTPSTASITLTWSASSGADNYTIMVTPLLPSGQSLVSITITSLQLTVLYNEEYSINITAQNCIGSNSTVVPFTVAGCSPPSPLINGSISEYSSGAVGAMLTFQCDTDYMPQEEVTSTCLSNRSWVPVPVCRVLFLSATTEGDPDIPIPECKVTGSGSILSTGSQLIITAIVCSLGFLLLGMFLGALLHYCIIRRTGKFKLTSSSPTPLAAPAPVIYEVVSPADSHTERKNDIELNENVAYGPVTNTTNTVQ